MCEELRSLISENENILDMKFIDKKIKSMMEYLVPESDSLEESYEIVLNYYKKNKLTKEYKMNKQIEMLIKRIDSLEKENKILRKKAEPIFYVNDNLKEPINYYDKNYMIFSDLNMNMINMFLSKQYKNTNNFYRTKLYNIFLDNYLLKSGEIYCDTLYMYIKDSYIDVIKLNNKIYLKMSLFRNKKWKITPELINCDDCHFHDELRRMNEDSIYKNNTIIDTTKPFMTKDFMNLTTKILVFMNCENNLNLEFLPETVERVVFITCEIDNFDNMKFGIPDITIIGCDIGNINRLKDFSNEIKVKIDNLGVSTKIEDFDKSCFPANVEII